MNDMKSPLPGVETAATHLLDIDSPPCWHRLTEDERYQLIERTAYELSAQRGFAPGHDQEDWFRAEQIIAMSLEGELYGSG